MSDPETKIEAAEVQEAEAVPAQTETPEAAPAEAAAEAAPAADKNAKKSKKPMTPEEKKENLKEWIKDLGIAVIVAALFLQFIMPTLVREHSMENTLHENDYVFVSRRHYTWLGRDLERGDIIVFNSDLTLSMGIKKLLVKRIIGLPGDTVSISDGKVYVNGRETDQSFTKDGYTNSKMDEVTVPEGCVFVLGDNRQNSTDSRSSAVGFVPISKIRGKVFFRLFPLGDMGGF